jgi:hypothetical protein
MIEYIPYFAGFITLVFGFAFAYALTNTKNDDEELEKKIEETEV